MPDIGSAIGIAGVGASLFGASKASSAAKGAANTQAAAAAQAAQVQQAAIDDSRRQFDLSRADLRPWRETGGMALSELGRRLGLNGGVESLSAFSQRFNQPIGRDWSPQEMANIQAQYQVFKAQQERANAANPQRNLLSNFSLADFQADPSYEFRRSEGMRGIDRAGAARGMQLSGATLKALNRYNSDLASQEYGAAYNRDAANKERQFNMLSGVAGTGQAATNTSAALGASNAALGMSGANSLGNIMADRANALAAGQVGSANAWAGGLSDAMSGLQTQYLYSRLFPPTNALSPRSSSGGGGPGFFNPNAIKFS